MKNTTIKETSSVSVRQYVHSDITSNYLYTDNVKRNRGLTASIYRKLNGTHVEDVPTARPYYYTKETVKGWTKEARAEATKRGLHKEERESFVRSYVKGRKMLEEFEYTDGYKNGVFHYHFKMLFHVYNRKNTDRRFFGQAERFRKLPYESKKDIAEDSIELFLSITNNADKMRELLEAFETESFTYDGLVSICCYRAFNNAMQRGIRRTAILNNAVSSNVFKFWTSDNSIDHVESNAILMVCLLNMFTEAEDRIILQMKLDGFRTSDIFNYLNESGYTLSMRSVEARYTVIKRTLQEAFNYKKPKKTAKKARLVSSFKVEAEAEKEPKKVEAEAEVIRYFVPIETLYKYYD